MSIVFNLIEDERRRQDENIELIASENFVSSDVLRAMGSCLTNKYSEGYPEDRHSGNRGRYYGGCQVVDKIEEYCCDKWREVFKTDYHVNVQPHSGSNANMAAYMSVCKPGDFILAMNLNNGVHLTHGSKVNFSGKNYNFIFYDVDENGFIDYESIRHQIATYAPRVVVAGASAYSRRIDFKHIREIIDSVPVDEKPYFMVDMAHIAGLVAAEQHPSPFGYADIITTTTHKTLRGPRGGVILMGKDFDNPWGKTTPKGEIKKMSALLDSAVFPGTQGGPLEHVIAAKAVAFGEALSPEFKVYQQQVKKNAAVMAQAFIDKGYKVISGGTDNHSMLIDLRTKFPDLTGKVAEQALVSADITTNKNMVPFDSRSAFQTSGLRFGTPAITTRGLKEDQMGWIVELIDRVLQDPTSEAVIASVREEVNKEMNQHPLFAW